MTRIITLTLLLLISTVTYSQVENSDSTLITFENFELPVDTFLNGSDLSGGFVSGNIFLPNVYTITPDFESWSGWSISTKTDTVTPGFLNQYSAATGIGADSSLTYAVTFASGGSVMKFSDSSSGIFQGMYITNSTYAYLSMQEGDAFAKRFGGESGDDPDFFLLTIKKYLDGEVSTDSVDFYLADFRAEDNSEDYILNTWEYVDLSNLGIADSLLFTLSSSDVGQFGMNTPAYFCVDNVSISEVLTSSHQVHQALSVEVYPNPVVDVLRIVSDEPQSYHARLFSVSGTQIAEFHIKQGYNEWNIGGYPSGTYLLVIQNSSTQGIKKLIKR